MTDANGVRRLAEDAEEEWLNRLADEAESEGTDGSVSLEELAALLGRWTEGTPSRVRHARILGPPTAVAWTHLATFSPAHRSQVTENRGRQASCGSFQEEGAS